MVFLFFFLILVLHCVYISVMTAFWISLFLDFLFSTVMNFFVVCPNFLYRAKSGKQTKQTNQFIHGLMIRYPLEIFVLATANLFIFTLYLSLGLTDYETSVTTQSLYLIIVFICARTRVRVLFYAMFYMNILCVS